MTRHPYGPPPFRPRHELRRHRAPHFVVRMGCAFAALIAIATASATLVTTFFHRAPQRSWVLAFVFTATLLVVLGFVATLRRVASVFREQDRLRRQLMADVAHELRTPLAILQGRIEGLLDGVYPRDDARIAELLGETQHLSRLVDDLRTLANAEAGALELRKERVDVAELLRDCASAVEASIAVDAPESLTVDADPLRLREVMLNLLTNAVQHAAGAHVRVQAAQRPRGVTVEVHDDGPGIAGEDLPRIFDRFHKGPRSRGSGLGLSIARKLVEAHGGTIEVASEPGRGTTFTVTLR